MDTRASSGRQRRCCRRRRLPNTSSEAFDGGGIVDLRLARLRRVGAALEAHQRLVLVTDARAPDAAVGRADRRSHSSRTRCGDPSSDRPADSGSVHPVEILPSPLVSTTPGHHPCEAPASCVLSNATVSIQPTALSCPKTRLSCSSNMLWSAAKQLSTIVNCFVFGSSNSICRALGPSIGKYFANLFVGSLQIRRLILRRTDPRGHPDMSFRIHRDAARIGLPLPDLLVPQYGDAGVFASSTGPFDGILISLVVFVRGSSTARMSEL